MSNLLAGVGRGQLKVLLDRVAARRQIFERYRDELADVPTIQWMPEPAWSRSNRWLTTGTIQSRFTDISAAEFIKRLAAELIEARPVWKPMQLQPVFSGRKYFCHGSESVSAKLFETGFCLPSGSNMTEQQQGRVIEAIRKILVA